VTCVHDLGGARDVADPRTGVGRRPTLRDQLLAARVMHNLVNQHQVTSLWRREDVPDLIEPPYFFLSFACETHKAIGGPGISHPFQAQYLKEMAQAVTGAMTEQVRRGGVSVDILPCPAAATTAPARYRRQSRIRTPRCWPASF